MKKRLKCCSALAAHLAVAGLGAAAVIVTNLIFASVSKSGLFNDTVTGNYRLFALGSLYCTPVLLVLTLLSRLSCEHSKRPSAFAVVVAAVSPVLGALSVVGAAVFYSYLTHGDSVSVEPYIIALGLGEAMLFALPGAVRLLFRIKKEKSHQ